MNRGLVLLLGALLVPTVAGLGSRSSDAATGTRFQAGSLALSAELRFSGSRVACPAQSVGANECYRVAGQGVVPGLGRVSESFVVPLVANAAGCPAPSTFQALGFLARLTVAGKGAIDLAVADSAACLDVGGVQRLSRPFDVTGGTRLYEAARGSGILSRHLIASQGTDTWKGRLVVPGVEFNLRAPTIRGATPKTVRAPKGAKRARVTYVVTADDDRDGRVRVSCAPKSGTRFKIGSTRVRCSATDGDGNAQTATFTVRVLKPR